MSLVKTYKDTPKLKINPLAVDWTDERRGKLVVKHPIRRDGKHLYWRADCDCGTQVEVTSGQIELSSSLDSCGRCQKLKHLQELKELPYTLIDDKVPVQKELPLEEDQGLTDALDSIYEPEPVKEKPKDVTLPTAWQVAGRCCEQLETLDDKDRIKAVQLIRVQLGYEL